MKTIINIVVLLLLSVYVAGQGKEPMAYGSFFKAGMEKIDGVLPVYCSGEKLYLEIPYNLLGREMLFMGIVTGGADKVQALTRGLGVAVFGLERDGRVSLSKGILGERASDTTSAMFRVMKERMLKPVDILYNTVAFGKDGKSPIIEITSQVKTGAEWFGSAEREPADVSKATVAEVKSIADGVKFSVGRVHTFTAQGFLGKASKEGIYHVQMDCLIRVLPEEDMVVRYADPRVGYGTISYLDYGRNKGGVEEMSIIHKWNLVVSPDNEEALLKGAPVEPENPIVFYVSPEVPERFRPAIRQAVAEWQTAFDNAGFKNALQVKDADVTTDLSLERAVISCSPTGGDVSTVTTIHPRTGEILNCRVNVPYSYEQEFMNKYLLQCGMVDERIMRDWANEEIALDILRWRVSMALGNVFGLETNYAGSAAFTSAQIRNPKWVRENGYTVSVMDEVPFNYAVQPGDGVDVRDLMPRVGAYDRWAILWGYKQFSVNPEADKDVRSLVGWCKLVKNAKVLRFRGYDKYDPMGMRGDLGADRVKTAELGMKNLERLFPMLPEVTAAKDGESWEILESLYSRVNSLYADYLNNTRGLIGGRYKAPLVRGNDEPTVSYVSKKEQKEAMDFLNRYLFAGLPEWYHSEIVRKNGWLDAEEMMRRYADSWFKEKLSADYINNLLAAEQVEGKKAYTVTDFFADLDKMVFDDYAVTGVASAYRKNIQNCYVKGMVDNLSKMKPEGTADDYSIMLLMQARKMAQRLAELSKNQTDEREGTYFRSLAVQLENFK